MDVPVRIVLRKVFSTYTHIFLIPYSRCAWKFPCPPRYGAHLGTHPEMSPGGSKDLVEAYSYAKYEAHMITLTV